MAEIGMTFKVADLQHIKDLIEVLVKHIDSLPQEVVECLNKLNGTESEGDAK